MPETSMECVVVLIDESSFTVPIKSTLLGSELLDMAASHVKVKEKDFFGLYTEGDGFKNWLELDRPVLDPSQDLPKKSQSVKIYFAFKFFVDDLRYLNDYVTVELLFQQARQAIMKCEIQTDDETIFELAACAMQAHYGDFRSEGEAKQHLNALLVLPAHVFKRHSVNFCEMEVIKYYRMMVTLTRGEAIFKYLEIIQSLPMYSVHFFEVKDKKDVALWLGVGPDGICQCPHDDRNEHDIRFQWLQLQNIYYRDKKFSMEVYQSTKPSKKGVGFGPVSVHAWYGSNSKVVMAIWKMARDQHMFYRNKRTNKHPHMGMNLTEIIRQLNKRYRSNVSPSSSHSSLSMESAKSNVAQASAEAVAAAKAAQSEMYSALLARRVALVQEFEKKAARYKEILIKEMQITGIPPEGLTPDEIEKMRKKFGVSFKFSKFVLDNNLAGSHDEVEQLEKQLEIQSSIIEASKTLLSQASTRKLKKDRKKEIKLMEEKYQRLEEKVQELKRSKRGSTSSSSSKFHVDSPTSGSSGSLTVPGSMPLHRRSGTPVGSSIDDSFIASMIFDTPPKPNTSSSGLQKSPHHKSTSALTDVQQQSSSAPNPAPHQHHHHHHQQQTHAQNKHVPISNSHSVAAYPTSQHHHNVPHHEHSHSDRSHNTTSDYNGSTRFTVGGAYPEDYDLSPPSSVVNAQRTMTSPQSAPPSAQKRGHNQGLREFDLTDEFLQHFSPRGTRGDPRSSGHTPSPPGGGTHHAHHHQQQHYSPQKIPPDQHQPQRSRIPFDIPATSSPVTRYKRASSPDIRFPIEGKTRGYLPQQNRSPSPSNHGYSGANAHMASSYHATGQYLIVDGHSPGQRSSSGGHGGSKTLPQSSIAMGTHYQATPPSQQQHQQHQMSQPVSRTGQTGNATGQTRNPNWYDSGESGVGGHHHSTPPTQGGNYPNQVEGHPPQPSQQRTGQQRDESYDLQAMLEIWQESSKNPFGEGTLV